MLTLIMLNTAMAAQTDGGVQLAQYNEGVGFARDMIEGQSFDIAEPRVESELACYDAIAIENLNVHIPIKTVDMQFDEDLLVVDIFFDTIEGQDMLIVAEDGNWTDWCIAFETQLRYARILDGRVSLALQAWVEDGSIQMAVANTPIVTGNIETDIAWVPDSLILTFVEDSIFNAVAERAEAEIPNLVSEYLNTTLFSTQIGPLGVDVELVDIDIVRHALMAGMDVDVQWSGDGCDTPQTDPVEGRNPALDLEDSHGSALGIGLTELQLNKVFHSAWTGGLLCFDEGPLAGLLDTVGDSFEDGIDDAELTLDFGAPPVLRIDEDQIRLSIDDFALSFSGMVDGDEVTFAEVAADIDATAEIRVDQDVSSFVLDLVSATLNVHTFAADPLLTDNEGVKERMVTFLEGWVMDTLSDRVGTVVLYGNTFYTNDIYIRADDVHTDNGGLLLRASLFHGDDPAVDTEPPQTEARILDSNNKALLIEWQGTDNKPATLAYSWRIDNESWSQWTADEQAEIPKPAPGEHVVQVRARDAWMNTDPSPAVVAFSVSSDNAADKQKQQGCMCSASSATGDQLAWLGLLPLLWSGRRRP